MRIESSSSSIRMMVNSDSSTNTSRISDNTRDTISKSDKEYEKACGSIVVSIALLVTLSCAFLFLIVDFIKQWVQMKK